MNGFCVRAARRLHRAFRGGCEGDRHYFVKQGGQWVCSICGATR